MCPQSMVLHDLSVTHVSSNFPICKCHAIRNKFTAKKILNYVIQDFGLPKK